MYKLAIFVVGIVGFTGGILLSVLLNPLFLLVSLGSTLFTGRKW